MGRGRSKVEEDSLETMIALNDKVNRTIIMQDPSPTLIETFRCLLLRRRGVAAVKWMPN